MNTQKFVVPKSLQRLFAGALIQICCVLCGGIAAYAQTQSVVFPDVLTFPQESPKSQIYQRFGLTDMTISYSSPAVKGRTIWGGIVPYGQVWRAGANGNTTISFSTDVSINGKPLPKGMYGVHLIPNEQEWIFIFSKEYELWGSYFYKQEHDALRVTVKPEKAEHREWLTFDVVDKAESQSTIVLHWEKLKGVLKVEANTSAILVQNIRKEMKTDVFWNPVELFKAASYFVHHDLELSEAEGWLMQAQRIDADRFKYRALRSAMQKRKGNVAKADSIMQSALQKAEQMEVVQYAFELADVHKKTNDAIPILQSSIKQNPDSWLGYYALGQMYEKIGKKIEAKEQYKISQPKAPEPMKARLAQLLAGLEKS